MNNISLRPALNRPFLYTYSALVAMIALIVLAGCGDSPTPTPRVDPTLTAQANSTTPSDLVVTYEYRAGSMPPPYHDEYTVEIGPGTQGKVNYSPDYPSDKTPMWTETFTPTTTQMEQLYALIIKNNLLRNSWNELSSPPVGGSVEWAIIQGNGHTNRIPVALAAGDSSDAGDLYKMITETIVPKSIWDSFEKQRTEWQKQFEGNTP